MRIAPIAEVKARFSAYVRASTDGPVVVTRHGKPVAVLLSVEDEEELERLVLAYTPKYQAILDTARRQIRETGGMRHEEFWREAESETLQERRQDDGVGGLNLPPRERRLAGKSVCYASDGAACRPASHFSGTNRLSTLTNPRVPMRLTRKARKPMATRLPPIMATKV